MHRRTLLPLVAALILLYALAGCAGPGASSGSFPATPTRTPFPPAPTPLLPTATPTPTIAVLTRDVSFKTGDGVTLLGTLYGRGRRAVVLANQADTPREDWSSVAQLFAARGYLALAFDYRGVNGAGGTFSGELVTSDRLAAIAYVRTQGAARVVLVGASLGGAVVLRAAGQEPAVAAVASISAPAALTGAGVSDGLLRRLTNPKLFVNSDRDDFADDTRHMYGVAAAPKNLQIYSGDGHGLELFAVPAPSLMQLLFTLTDGATAGV